MTAPSPKRHGFAEQQEAELSRWPGVTWTRQHRGKHYALVLEYGGLSRFVIYPASPGDMLRGGLNHVRDIRAVLTAMGAERVAEARSSRPSRRRNRTEPRRLEVVTADTRLSRDPFAALVDFRPRQRGWARIRDYFVRPQGAAQHSGGGAE